jgi:hypothetical protein
MPSGPNTGSKSASGRILFQRGGSACADGADLAVCGRGVRRVWFTIRFTLIAHSYGTLRTFLLRLNITSRSCVGENWAEVQRAHEGDKVPTSVTSHSILPLEDRRTALILRPHSPEVQPFGKIQINVGCIDPCAETADFGLLIERIEHQVSCSHCFEVGSRLRGDRGWICRGLRPSFR